MTHQISTISMPNMINRGPTTSPLITPTTLIFCNSILGNCFTISFRFQPLQWRKHLIKLFTEIRLSSLTGSWIQHVDCALPTSTIGRHFWPRWVYVDKVILLSLSLSFGGNFWRYDFWFEPWNSRCDVLIHYSNHHCSSGVQKLWPIYCKQNRGRHFWNTLWHSWRMFLVRWKGPPCFRTGITNVSGPNNNWFF